MAGRKKTSRKMCEAPDPFKTEINSYPTLKVKEEPSWEAKVTRKDHPGEWKIKTEEVDVSDYECENESGDGPSSQPYKPLLIHVPNHEPFEKVKTEPANLRHEDSLFLAHETFECALCLSTYPTKAGVEKHITLYCFKKEGRPRMAVKSLQRATKVNKGDIRWSNKLDCRKCLMRFSNASEVNQHRVKFHLKLTKHSCEVCGKSFPKRSGKMRHMLVHSAGRTHQCNLCNLVFMGSIDRQQHNKRAHPEYRPYKCPYCDKTFFKSWNRSRHVNIHTQKETFECEQCNRKFTQGSNLKSHMYIHTGVRPHTCLECGKSFRVTSDLKKHMLVHSGVRDYKCRTCDKPFKTISGRNYHERIHSGVRNHRCDLCSRAFGFKFRLERHMAVHSKEKRSERVISAKTVTRSKRKQKSDIDEDKTQE